MAENQLCLVRALANSPVGSSNEPQQVGLALHRMPVAGLQLVLRVRDGSCRLLPDEIVGFYSQARWA